MRCEQRYFIDMLETFKEFTFVLQNTSDDDPYVEDVISIVPMNTFLKIELNSCYVLIEYDDITLPMPMGALYHYTITTKDQKILHILGMVKPTQQIASEHILLGNTNVLLLSKINMQYRSVPIDLAVKHLDKHEYIQDSMIGPEDVVEIARVLQNLNYRLIKEKGTE